jgi:hypothetical protein
MRLPVHTVQLGDSWRAQLTATPYIKAVLRIVNACIAEDNRQHKKQMTI